jgi:hypothetical protein
MYMYIHTFLILGAYSDPLKQVIYEHLIGAMSIKATFLTLFFINMERVYHCFILYESNIFHEFFEIMSQFCNIKIVK